MTVPAKHVINEVNDWATESIEGFVRLNSAHVVALSAHPNVIVRRDYLTLCESSGRVALISGGGSGHEPTHQGFIGHGMLTAAVCGHLFASPSIASILAAIRLVGRTNQAGVLLIVKNYTGDRLNFGLASKRAQLEGINVDWLLVDDDVALVESADERDSSVGKRGLGGVVLIHKIAGALAEQRMSLVDIKSTLEQILRTGSLRTLGVSLTGRVRLPGETAASDTSDKIEIGLGIHGEAGRLQVPLTKSRELVRTLFDDYLLRRRTDDQVESNDYCLLVNNLGGLSTLELHVLLNDCMLHLAESGCNMRRVYCGTLTTSLNMNGFSVTLLSLNEASSAPLLLKCLDASTSAPAWPRTFGQDVQIKIDYLDVASMPGVADTATAAVADKNSYVKYDDEASARLLRALLTTVCDDIILTSDYLNELDSECGDGDCGSSLANMSRRILADIEANRFDFDYPHQTVLRLSEIFESGGGTLCILLALFMSSSAQAFNTANIDFAGDKELFWPKIWHKFMEMGTSAMREYGRAKPGQRSIVDPLSSILEFMRAYIDSFEPNARFDAESFLKKLVDVAYESAMATAKMHAHVGRASYVNQDVIKLPDAGSLAASSVVSSIYKAYLIFKSSK